jgi:dynein heavy chain
VDTKGRVFMDSFLRTELAVQSIPNCFPKENSIYDYMFDLNGKFTTDNKPGWIPWMTTSPEYIVDAKAEFSDLIVPTVDSVRYTYLLDQLVSNGKHCLMTGPTGTGKSVNISKHLQFGLPDT